MGNWCFAVVSPVCLPEVSIHIESSNVDEESECKKSRRKEKRTKNDKEM